VQFKKQSKADRIFGGQILWRVCKSCLIYNAQCLMLYIEEHMKAIAEMVTTMHRRRYSQLTTTMQQPA
jgi:hypothetical protein